MLILIILFLLLKAYIYVYLSSLYLGMTIKNYRNILAKDLKDRFIGINIKQDVTIKTPQMGIYIYVYIYIYILKSNFVRVNRLFALN